MFKASTLSLMLLMLSLPGFGQSVSGSLSGRVTDPQGAVISDASVTVLEPSKNVTSTLKTGTGGEFNFSALQPGTYTLTVEVAGFKKLERAGIPLNVDDKLTVGDLAMQVGALTETVEVSAQAAMLQSESAERSATINNRQMENIEVNGRNPLDLTKLIPGVVSTASFQVGGVGGLSGIQVNGNRGTSNQLTINGIGDIDTGNNGAQNVTISLDSMAEFKVLTGMYQAEYGRNAGAQISMVTKSGTDQFHGSGYFYHRHEEFNANTWYNNARGLGRSLYRYNDPGYTIGGPVFIPKLLPQTKNRLFFFWSQEWQRQLVPNTPRNVTVPTALERIGDFSQSVDNNGKPLVIKDPITGAPFSGNKIAANRLYAPGVALMNLFPLPNVTNQVGYNYASQISGSQPRREDLLRVDYNLTQNIRVFGHYINNEQPIVYPYGSFVLGINVPVAPILYPNPGSSWATGVTWVITPTMTNEANFGLTHNSIDIVESGTKLTRTTSGISLPLLYPSALQNDYIPGFTFSGSHLANGPDFTSVRDAPFHNYNTSIDFSDNLTKVWSEHTIKTGFYMQRSRKNQSSFGSNNGFYNFGDTSNNPLDTGYGYSNAALSVYQNFDQASSYINGQFRYWNIEGFLQDTWKVTRRLTFDYGLRVAWYQPQYDASQQASTFVLSAWNPAKAPRLYQPAFNAQGVRSAYDSVTNTYLPSYDIGLEVPNSGDPYNGVLQAGKGIDKYLQSNPGPQWGPRFGLAWDVTGKQNIVVRTGGGIYYDRFQGNRAFDFIRNPPEGLDPQLLYGYAQNIDPKNVLLAPLTVYAADPTGKLPTTYMYQFSIQSRMPWNMMLDTAYVGTQGRHLQDNRNLNPVAYGATLQPQNQDPTLVAANPTALLGNNSLNPNLLRPLRGYGQVNLYESAATSNYNALQINLTKRASTGLFFGIAYTWSKALTNATSDTTFVRADNLTRQADYGPANFDRRHVFAANYVYNLPGFRNANGLIKTVANGWQISGVTQVTSGAPFTPTVSISGVNSTNITGNVLASATNEGARVGVVPGCNPYTGSSNPFNRLNTACFTAPQPGSLGLESGVNWLYAPGLINFDMSLQKEFAVKERLRLQFRVDAFNVFNHPNFTVLNSTINFSGSYPNNTVVANAPYNAAGVLTNQNGFGTVGTTNGIASNTAVLPAPARILQMLIRFQF